MSRQKGKRGERELAQELRSKGFSGARRGQQFSGIEGDDVVGIPGVHIECKRTETLSIYKALEQADEDAQDGEVPVVFHRRSGKAWIAFVYLDDIDAFIERWTAGKPGTPPAGVEPDGGEADPQPEDDG